MHKILTLLGILLLAGIASAGTSYVHGADGLLAKINDSGTFYYHPDHLGSTSAITDEAGVVVEEQLNLPFGEQISGSEKYSFTGKEQDETGLQYFGARYYDNKIGRFISIDPIKNGINWYGYAKNNPLKYVDPRGEAEKSVLNIGIIMLGADQLDDEKISKVKKRIAQDKKEIKQVYGGFLDIGFSDTMYYDSESEAREYAKEHGSINQKFLIYDYDQRYEYYLRSYAPGKGKDGPSYREVPYYGTVFGIGGNCALLCGLSEDRSYATAHEVGHLLNLVHPFDSLIHTDVKEHHMAMWKVMHKVRNYVKGIFQLKQDDLNLEEKWDKMWEKENRNIMSGYKDEMGTELTLLQKHYISSYLDSRHRPIHEIVKENPGKRPSEVDELSMFYYYPF